jgi:hypothetical protein
MSMRLVIVCERVPVCEPVFEFGFVWGQRLTVSASRSAADQNRFL